MNGESQNLSEEKYRGEYMNGWFHGYGEYLFDNNIKFIGKS